MVCTRPRSKRAPLRIKSRQDFSPGLASPTVARLAVVVKVRWSPARARQSPSEVARARQSTSKLTITHQSLAEPTSCSRYPAESVSAHRSPPVTIRTGRAHQSSLCPNDARQSPSEPAELTRAIRVGQSTVEHHQGLSEPVKSNWYLAVPARAHWSPSGLLESYGARRSSPAVIKVQQRQPELISAQL
jgi:hypothetical protein